jgi:flagellar hook assembly protein FlgD
VFNLGGDLVDIIYRGRQGSGSYTYHWDATNRAGREVARGIYFIRVIAPGIDEYRKVMVVKD